MSTKATQPPAYVPVSVVNPWRTDKLPAEEPKVEDEDKLVASPLGIGLHFVIGLVALGFAIAMVNVGTYKRDPMDKLIASCFFLASFSQFVFSCLSFSKSFLIGSSGFLKFLRLGLTCFVVTNITVFLCILAGVRLESALAAVLVAPNIFTAVFLPFFFYLNDERSKLRPFVRAD